MKKWLQDLMDKFMETSKLRSKNEDIKKLLKKIEKQHKKLIQKLRQSDSESMFSMNKLQKFETADFNSIVNTPDHQRDYCDLNPFQNYSQDKDSSDSSNSK